MCIIIDRKADVVIPKEQIELACDINKHGFGVSWIEKRRIKTFRNISQPTDPQEVNDQLDKLKKHRVYLHIRHATVGPVTMENNHPFNILTQEKDGRDLCFMHNGTLWDFDPKTVDVSMSDSAYFAQSVVRPMAIRWAAWMPKKSFLDDTLFIKLLCKYITGDGKLVMYDNLGGTMVINRTKGKDYNGYWASNDHLDDKYHYRSSTKQGTKWHRDYDTSGAYGAYGTRETDYAYDSSPSTGPKITQSTSAFNKTAVDLPWEKETTNILEPKTFLELVESKSAPGLYVAADNTYENKHLGMTVIRRERFEMSEARALIETTKEREISVVRGSMVKLLNVKRESFVELTGIQKLEDVGRLSKVQLVELSENFPMATAELIIDLLARIVPVPLDKEGAAMGTGQVSNG